MEIIIGVGLSLFGFLGGLWYGINCGKSITEDIAVEIGAARRENGVLIWYPKEKDTYDVG